MSGQKAPSNLPTGIPVSTEGSSPASETEVPLEATPGVETLLRGKIEAPKPETKNPFAQPVSESKPPVNWSVLIWILVVADILLIVPTSFFVLTKSGRMTFMEGTLCVITFGFAACLGCIAFFVHRHEKK
ncbi:MAG: hypothetical protein JWM68_5585 [Verrucomicrobiales bacterium]|nr:hypothetical protein [Verrucomicrobiales bacterium]